jgi:DNA repair exonuclease SbcCD ATPase subunit
VDRSIYLAESATFVKSMISTRNDIQAKIQAKEERKQFLSYIISSLEEAKHVITNEINAIQVSLKEDLDSLVTIALNIVYEDRDLKFAMLFDKSKAGISQYKPVIVENDEEFSPKEDQCGGSLDVISYALRIILHSFEKPKGRDFMLFDEPFKFLGGGVLAERASDMAKKINTDLGIQALIISHDETAISKADIVYHVEHDGKVSTVNKIRTSGTEHQEEVIERIR